jgi:hypothetical protein
VHAVDLVACAIPKDLIEFCQDGMVDLQFLTARAANQMMVIVPGNFVNQLTAADMASKHQALFGQKGQGAIDGWLGQTRHQPPRPLVDFYWRQMPVIILKDVQDYPALGGHPVSSGMQRLDKRIVHNKILLLQKVAITYFINNRSFLSKN